MVSPLALAAASSRSIVVFTSCLLAIVINPLSAIAVLA